MSEAAVRAGLDLLDEAAGRVFVGGRWLAASETAEAVSPSTGRPLAPVAFAGEAEVDAAVAAARGALAAGDWAGALPAQRARLLLRLADLVEADVDRIAAIEAADGVRPFVEARYGDVPTGAAIFRYFAGLAGTIEGAVKYPSIAYNPPGTTVRAFLEREPVGVVAAIIPWNFPFIMACARVAPALAAGCAVVLKPAEQTSLSALALARLAEAAGLPAGVLNVVTGVGEAAGAALVRHDGVDKISFTGSTEVGREIGAVAGARFRRHSLELGGKCAAVVLADADLDRAAAGLVGSSFGNAGQVCVSSSRILAHRSVRDALVERMAAIAGGLRPGGTFEEGAGIGPLVTDEHRSRVAAIVEDAVARGARRVGGAGALPEAGWFLRPAILCDVPDDARLANEEAFGPVTAVEAFDDLDAAIDRANATPYGLAASVWTERWADADRAARRLQAGAVYVNCHAYADPSLPLGGLKASGIGVEGGREGLDAYLKSKTVCAVL